MAEWIADYATSFIETSDLQAEVDSYMKQFDLSKTREEEEEKLKEGQPDDDGWITVTKQYVFCKSLENKNIHIF